MSSFGLLALGSNMPSQFGTPIQTLNKAIVRLNRNPIHLCAVSRFFQTPSFPSGSGPDYINAAAVFKADCPSAEVLSLFHDVEQKFGRMRQGRWESRPLDVDLIAIDARVLPSTTVWKRWRNLPMAQQVTEAPSELILPHPRWQDRGFVLAPLMDIAAGWKHPVTGLTVAQMFAQLPESAQKEPIPL